MIILIHKIRSLFPYEEYFLWPIEYREYAYELVCETKSVPPSLKKKYKQCFEGQNNDAIKSFFSIHTCTPDISELVRQIITESKQITGSSYDFEVNPIFSKASVPMDNFITEGETLLSKLVSNRDHLLPGEYYDKGGMK